MLTTQNATSADSEGRGATACNHDPLNADPPIDGRMIDWHLLLNALSFVLEYGQVQIAIRQSCGRYHPSTHSIYCLTTLLTFQSLRRHVTVDNANSRL